MVDRSHVHAALTAALLAAAAGCAPPPEAAAPRPAPAPAVVVDPPAPVEPPAPPVSNRLLVDGTSARCPEARCRVELDRFTGKLQLLDPVDGARLRYLGGITVDSLDAAPGITPERVARASWQGPQESVELEVEVILPDGQAFAGRMPIPLRGVANLVGQHLDQVEAGGVVAPSEPPYEGPVRAMWIPWGAEGQRLRGEAGSFREIDWVLLASGKSRDITCGADEGSVTDLVGTVYERRTGKVVGEKVFPSPLEECIDAVGVLDATPAAAWAWDVLRPSLP